MCECGRGNIYRLVYNQISSMNHTVPSQESKAAFLLFTVPNSLIFPMGFSAADIYCMMSINRNPERSFEQFFKIMESIQ